MNRRRSWYRGVALASMLVAAGCGTGGSGQKVALQINSPSNLQVVPGNVVKLSMGVSGLKVVKPDGDTSGRTGHYHVFIDRDPVAPGMIVPKEAGIVHSEANPIVVTGLTPGWHRLVVVPGDGAHHRIGNVLATVNLNVLGPSIAASVPAVVPSGEPAVVTISVVGVKLAAANGDTTGASGHLHLFIDRDPTPAGQAIPKEAGIIHTVETTVSVPNLAPGAHTIWVVLGNGVHTPFDPPVEAKVTFSVD
ncbi:MAG: DUF4399 domain-containing protein [Actinomycetota bacterium]|nr:DUF4399 domain-containing protein [Actinomycetota bacterium]